MRIKEILRDKKMSVTQLAELMSVKQESLSRTINGNPTKDTLQKIADALGVHISELFEQPKKEVENEIKCPKCGATLELKEKP